MIKQKSSLDQLPPEMRPAFQELDVLNHLRNSGFKKTFGYTCSHLFLLVFVLLFHQKNWIRLLESAKSEAFPGKDAVYRLLNHSGFTWRRFLSSLSSDTVQHVETLTSNTRTSVFIVDDSMFERNRSKAVELLARFKDHATGTYYKDFRMLTLGWSDGHTFLPLDFALLSSVKAGLTGMNLEVDKRSCGYKRRKEAGLRWDIEVLFKCAKSLLHHKANKRAHHTTIVFTRYILALLAASAKYRSADARANQQILGAALKLFLQTQSGHLGLGGGFTTIGRIDERNCFTSG